MSHFSYPFPRLVLPALRVLLGLPASISRDAALLIPGIQPAPCVLGQENVPAETPFVLVLNHYDRPGLGTWWGAAVLLCAIVARRTRAPSDVHIAIAREWWYPKGVGRLIKQPLTRWFFGQVAKSYGLILLPPVVEQQSSGGEGVLGVRHALSLTRGKSPELVGIAPEGRTGNHGELIEPPAVAGLFLAALTHNTIPCLPAGIYEDDNGVLTVHVGKPFLIGSDRTLPRKVQDRLVARTVMVHIGMLLPERMWGAYRAEIRTVSDRSEAEILHDP